MNVNTKEIFTKDVRDSFLKAYRGWVEICRPKRIKTGGCSDCPLDGFHGTGICGAFQDIGMTFEKSISTLVRSLENEKSIRDRSISDFKEFMVKYACPGPDLFQPLARTEAET